MWHWGPPNPHSGRGRALRGQDGGPPDPHPYLLAREFRILAANRAFKPARWTVVPTGPAQRARMRPLSSPPPHPPPGGPAASAWKWHPAPKSVQVAATIQTGPGRTGPLCIAGVSGVSPGRRPATVQGFIGPARSAAGGSRIRRLPACSGWLDGSRWVPGPDRPGRLTEPQSLTVASIVSRRAARCSQLACATGAHRIRAVLARAGATCRLAGPSTSSLPASSCISNDQIYLGAFGLTGGFWVRGCTKLSQEPKYSQHRAPQSARASRNTQVPAAGE
jgi:hypothetical protein